MATGILSINLTGIVENWRALDAMSAPDTETSAVVKANGYGLDATRVAHALYQAGARTFFVAATEEGEAVRTAVGPDARVCVFSGHMHGDTDMIRAFNLIPMLNSVDQITRHWEALPGHAFGIQLDTGMNRLGMEPADWDAVRDIALSQNPMLLMSHLACADEPDHPMNQMQLDVFHKMTKDAGVPLSLAATGGVLMGQDYHFDLTRPGIGLYGGLPFAEATPVVHLTLPVIQARALTPGEAVGYGGSYIAGSEGAKIATVAAGYADGLIRAMSGVGHLWAGDQQCPIAGRVSMDMIGVDVSHLDVVPATLDIICPLQGVDALAEAAGTIGYEILTSLGARYTRQYITE